jgi:outer membrane protein OmpA-like peptidoglycan-associated protein
MKKIIPVILLAWTMSITAQQRTEISLGAGGGLSSLYYSSQAGNASLGLGGTAGMELALFVSGNVAIVIGAGAALYRSSFQPSELSGKYYVTDGNSSFTYEYTLSNYKESQSVIAVNIPLMLRYQGSRFYAAAGIRAGIPLKTNFNIEPSNLSAWGREDNGGLKLLPDDPRLMEWGFGTYAAAAGSGTFSMKNQYFAAVEVGMRWQLNPFFALYTGIYADYGLNNVTKAANKHVIEWKDYDYKNELYTPNSVVKSKLGNDNALSKINLVDAGIKIAIALDATALRNRPREEPQDIVYDEPIVEEVQEQEAQEEEIAQEPQPDIVMPKPKPREHTLPPLPVSEYKPFVAPTLREMPRISDELYKVIGADDLASEQNSPQPSIADDTIKSGAAATQQASERMDGMSLHNLADSLSTIETAQEQTFAQILSNTADSLNAAAIAQSADNHAPAAAGNDAPSDFENPIGGYSLNATALPQRATDDLNKKIAFMKNNPHIKIIIEGHTCDLGSPIVNYSVAMRRARFIKKYLIKHGIAQSRIIDVVSKGEEIPIVPNNSAKNRMLNRRIVLRIAQ